MILTLGEWKFDIEMETTMEYSAAEAADHCDCGYCRNFYAAMDGQYPSVRPFFAQFGLDMEAPDALVLLYDCVSKDGSVECFYTANYSVSGKVLKYGDSLEVDGIQIAVESESGNISQSPAPNFFLQTNMFSLPWVLDEPIEEVLSPANDADFQESIWDKLLGMEAPTQIQ